MAVRIAAVVACLAPAMANAGQARAVRSQALQAMDPARGRELFVSKGCVLCHAVNEVGGVSAPPLDASNMGVGTDPLDLVAAMWRGAEAMIFMQQQELGEQIEFTAQELADLSAFLLDEPAQRSFSADAIPATLRPLVRR